ncbi:MAG: hypothetical protein JNK05_13320 [Myxococcales bacterium]|nr:hypothetical protein [Myxococcales bacterium]
MATRLAQAAFTALWLSTSSAACTSGPMGGDGGQDVRGIEAGDAAVACTNCDDGIDCTDDTCMSNMCVHTPVPARCAAGASCDLRMGCRMGRPCASASDCVDADPCTTNERCDSASRTCLHDLLDGDRDGFPPRVCGGGDCDDANANVRPGTRESCNGVDDNCDGTVDEPGSRGTDDCPGRQCVNARCEGTCLPGFALCGGSCRDLQTDNEACGSCTQQCLSSTCVSGHCTCANSNETLCARADNPSALECSDLQTSSRNCGACGRACATGQTCTGSTCVCNAGFTQCPGQPGCFDLQTDFGNCGRCGNACPGGTGMRICSLGRCTCTYVRPGDGRELPGFACGTQCIPAEGFQTDPMNCGSCGNVCPSGLICRDGACACPEPNSSVVGGRCICNAGLVDCCPPDARDSCVGGLWCVDTNTHAAHCGACGVTCGLGGRCVAGRCEWSSCALPPIVCAGASTCPASDPRNCGSCGNVCPAGRACVRGMCS